MTKANYPVGFGRPPKEHQYRPGQSGNPAGRPKGSRNFLSDLRDVLAETITIQEGNDVVQISKQHAILNGLAQKAIDADLAAIKTIVDILGRPTVSIDEDDGVEAPEDRAILAAAAKSDRKQVPVADPKPVSVKGRKS